MELVLIPNPINSKPKHAHDQKWRSWAPLLNTSGKEEKHDAKTVHNTSLLHYKQMTHNLACGMRFNSDMVTFIHSLTENWNSFTFYLRV